MKTEICIANYLNRISYKTNKSKKEIDLLRYASFYQSIKKYEKELNGL